MIRLVAECWCFSTITVHIMCILIVRDMVCGTITVDDWRVLWSDVQLWDGGWE